MLASFFFSTVNLEGLGFSPTCCAAYSKFRIGFWTDRELCGTIAAKQAEEDEEDDDVRIESIHQERKPDNPDGSECPNPVRSIN